MTRNKTKRTNKKSRFNKKSRSRRNSNSKKIRGGKIERVSTPIPLPKVPPLAPPLTRPKQKGGFKADEVDILEDRDDDWMITKQ